MAGLALALYAVYLVLAVGLRILIHHRRTGATGLHGVSGRPGSVEWFGGVLFVLAFGLGIAAAVLGLHPVGALDSPGVRLAGVVLFAAGAAGTLAAQAAMRSSWRIGVDERDRTPLVTGGPFGLVRNPIYSAMLPAVLGIVLVAASPAALAAFAMLVVALELQTRLVEEPHLLRVHGREYAEYAARVGRFLPSVGRLRAG